MTFRPRLHHPSSTPSLRRRVVCDERLPVELRNALRRGEVERLLKEGKLLQSKPRCEVVRLDRPVGPLLIKRHTWGDTSRTWRMALRAPVARKCYEYGHWLRDRGVPTPRPLALVEDRFGPLGFRSYLITEFYEGESLFDLIRWGEPSLERCEGLARQVANLWQRLIALGAIHCDLKPENFIVDRADRVWLIDLEKFRPRLPQPRLIAQHLTDAESFLHIRTWRHQLAAAELFRQALLNQTLLGQFARQTGGDHLLLRQGYSQAELDLRVAVVILTNRETTPAAVESTRQAANLLADEVVVTDEKLSTMVAIDSPWLLLLRAGERISPDLARHLVERLLAHPEAAAVRIGLLQCDAAGNRQGVRDTLSPNGIRAVRSERGLPSLEKGKLMFQPEGLVLNVQDAIEVDPPVAATNTNTLRRAA